MPRVRIPLPAVLLAASLTLLVSGCGRPPELEPTPTVPVPTGTTPPTGPTSTLPPGFTPPPTNPPTVDPAPSFGESYAVPCAGRPDASVVVSLVRRSGAIPGGGSRATASTGPLCAGTWQYTVLTVPGKEPVQVVTKGTPDNLKLVTAGTDVCTVDVRAGAPPGILQVANCTG